MRQITLDIETVGEFSSGGDFSKQELTLVGVHNSQTNEFTSYIKEELPQLWPLLESADMLIGYNTDHFDIPILNRYYPGDLTKIKSLDLLKEVRNVLGRRLKLDNIAEATLGEKKSGSGLQAQDWWKRGEIEKIRKYCLDDVRLTRNLYDYAKKEGHVKYNDFDGVREVKLDTSKWEEDSGGAMTHTLPF